MVHVVPFGGFNGDGFASCDRYCLMSRLDLDSGVAEVGGERPWTGKGACVVGQSTVRSRFAGGGGGDGGDREGSKGYVLANRVAEVGSTAGIMSCYDSTKRLGLSFQLPLQIHFNQKFLVDMSAPITTDVSNYGAQGYGDPDHTMKALTWQGKNSVKVGQLFSLS